MCGEEATSEVAGSVKDNAAAPNANTQATIADPVNVVTGAFLQTETDLTIPCGRLNLEFTRHYDSGRQLPDGSVGPLGRGWTHSYNLVLNLQDSDSPIYTDDRFSDVKFAKDPDRENTFLPVGKSGVELHRKQNGYHLRQGDGLRAEFCLEGILRRIVRPGPKLDVTLDFECDTQARLIRVKGVAERELRFAYSNERTTLIESVSDHTGRSWRFTYSNGLLVQAKRPDDAIIEYEYFREEFDVASARKKTKKRIVCGMSKIYWPRLEPDDKVAMVTNRYTSEGRVFEQLDSLGNVTAFDYNLYTRTTCVTDPEGWTTVYFYDSSDNTIKIRRPSGGTFEWVFDDRRNLIAETQSFEGKEFSRNEYVEFSSNVRPHASFASRALGNPSVQQKLAGRKIANGHDRIGNKPLVKDSAGNVTRFLEFNKFGRPGLILLPDSSRMKLKYDEISGLPIQQKRELTVFGSEQKLNWMVVWKYDDWGNLIQRQEMGGRKWPRHTLQKNTSF